MRSFLSALFLWLASCSLAGAQSPCGPAKELAAVLAERHGESVIAAGAAANGTQMMELFLNPETGSWTIMLTDTAGIGCVKAVGEGMILSPAKKPGRST